MGRPRKDDSAPAATRPPATTPQAQENRLISLAVDLVEKQLREGTASSQVITHFLKLGTEKELLERKKLEHDILLTEAKVQSIAAEGDIKTLIENAMESFKGYQATEVEDEFLG